MRKPLWPWLIALIKNAREHESEALRPAIRAEAAAWLARLHSEDRDDLDEAAFRIWLDESQLHKDAFDRLTDAWETAGGLGFTSEEFIKASADR